MYKSLKWTTIDYPEIFSDKQALSNEFDFKKNDLASGFKSSNNFYAIDMKKRIIVSI